MNRIHLGCGGIRLPGFLNIDRVSDAADLKLDAFELREFPAGQTEILYSNAFLEHVGRMPELHDFLATCSRLLTSTGITLHLGIPNFAEVAACYVEKRQGLVDWDGGVFGIENVNRYTHGTFDPHDTNLEWLHKDIYDAPKLLRCGREVFPFVEVITYRYPGESYPLALGMLASKHEWTQKGLTNLLRQDFIYGVDLSSVEFG